MRLIPLRSLNRVREQLSRGRSRISEVSAPVIFDPNVLEPVSASGQLDPFTNQSRPHTDEWRVLSMTPMGPGTKSTLRRRWALLVWLIAVGCGRLGACLYCGVTRPLDRPLRIGIQNSPPYHFPDANGDPTGSTVDVVREAARRRNIELEWRYSSEGPERALSSGAVDLWPIVGDLPERRPFLYVSAPWVKMTYVLLFAEPMQLKDAHDVAGKTLAVSRISLDI